MDDELPAVIIAGDCDLDSGFGRLRTELAAGAVIRIINRRTGCHRAWLAPGRPPGAGEVTRLCVIEFCDSIGATLDTAAKGAARSASTPPISAMITPIRRTSRTRPSCPEIASRLGLNLGEITAAHEEAVIAVHSALALAVVPADRVTSLAGSNH